MTTGYPLHSHLSPSLPLPCATVCRLIPIQLYMDVCVSLQQVEVRALAPPPPPALWEKNPWLLLVGTWLDPFLEIGTTTYYSEAVDSARFISWLNSEEGEPGIAKGKQFMKHGIVVVGWGQTTCHHRPDTIYKSLICDNSVTTQN